MTMTTRQFLEEATLPRALVDRFLDPDALNWSSHDPVLGFRVKDAFLRYGMYDTYSIFRYGKYGERRTVNYGEMPCRINTYGDSFTMGSQVNDGETWQEILAAHFGEPVRNFGVGAYGVYQAYRRMAREELTDAAAAYVILNIYAADHVRNIYRWRWLRDDEARRAGILQLTETRGVWELENPPWAHVELDLSSGRFVEIESLFPKPEDLYQLCDPQFVWDKYHDDLWVQVLMAQRHATDTDTAMLSRAADVLGLQARFRNADETVDTAANVFQECALRSTLFVLDLLKKFADSERKKVMVLLSYSPEQVEQACSGQGRLDQPLIDYLTESGFPFVDSLEKHVADFATFAGTPKEYVGKYYISHYSPIGNHFFAYAVRDAIVNWLDPRPPTYRVDAAAVMEILSANSAS